MVQALRIYCALVGASFRSQMSYRRSFVLEAFSKLLITGLEVVPIFIVFSHIETLAGWTQWEVIYLYGLASFGMAIGETITSGMKDMPALVRDGELDRVLIRPVNSLVQILGRTTRLHHLGRLAQGAAAYFIAISFLNVDWTAAHLFLAVSSLLAGAVLYASLFIASGATCFWTTESGETFNAFTYGGVDMTQYPITVYRPWLRFVFVFIVPVGFVSYFPSAVILGKHDPLGFPVFSAYLAPVIAALFLSGVLCVWKLGMRRYESTGS